LVDSDEVLGDFLLNILKLAFFRLLESRLQMLHRLSFVQNLLLADAESLVGLSFALDIFKFN